LLVCTKQANGEGVHGVEAHAGSVKKGHTVVGTEKKCRITQDERAYM
jgi:hypothetical protein